MAKPLLVTTSHQGRTGGTAKRLSDVAIGADQPPARETIKVRRWNIPGAIEPNVGISLVIGNDEQHIRKRARWFFRDSSLARLRRRWQSGAPTVGRSRYLNKWDRRDTQGQAKQIFHQNRMLKRRSKNTGLTFKS